MDENSVPEISQTMYVAKIDISTSRKRNAKKANELKTNLYELFELLGETYFYRLAMGGGKLYSLWEVGGDKQTLSAYEMHGAYWNTQTLITR
jgi:hypothetical protein